MLSGDQANQIEVAVLANLETNFYKVFVGGQIALEPNFLVAHFVAEASQSILSKDIGQPQGDLIVSMLDAEQKTRLVVAVTTKLGEYRELPRYKIARTLRADYLESLEHERQRKRKEDEQARRELLREQSESAARELKAFQDKQESRRQEIEAANRKRLEQERAEQKRRAAEAERARLIEAEAAADKQRQFLVRANELSALLSRDFLGNRYTLLEGQTEEERERVVCSFVTTWVLKHLGLELTPEQASAVAAVNHTRVTARAGSGKTTVLACRQIFLMKHCNVDPAELICLVFNTAARAEIRHKISKLLLKFDSNQNRKIEPMILARAENDPALCEQLIAEFNHRLPWIFTWHAFAKRIVETQASTRKLVVDDDGISGPVSELIREIFREMLDSPEGSRRIRSVMLPHFLDSWRFLVNERRLTPEQAISLRSMIRHETLVGEYVKSGGEKTIADWLFRNGVRYEYEAPMSWDGKTVYPDFTLRDEQGARVHLEFWGMISDENYRQTMALKKDFYRRSPNKLISLEPSQVSSSNPDQFDDVMRRLLTNSGIKLGQKQSDDQIWTYLLGRRRDEFLELISSFIRQLKARDMSPDMCRKWARALVVDSDSKLRVHDFTLLMADFLEQITNRLKSRDQADFLDYFREARALVDRGDIAFKFEGRLARVNVLRFISLDEFQDYTQMYRKLLMSVQVRSGAQIFAVGDDWQSINGFSGAQVELFHAFSDDWKGGISLDMPLNRRSTPEIVNLGNQLMENTGGVPAKPGTDVSGTIAVLAYDRHFPTEREACELKLTAQDLTLKRLIVNELAAKPALSLRVLFRTKTVRWNYLRSENLDEYKARLLSDQPKSIRQMVTFSTAHASKGLESDLVVVVDAERNTFPLIKSTYRLMEILGQSLDSVIADEQRLFYVALTRAKSKLIFLTNTDSPSPFLGHEYANLDISRCTAFASPASTKALLILDFNSTAENMKINAKELENASFYKCVSRLEWVREVDMTVDTSSLMASLQKLLGKLKVFNLEATLLSPAGTSTTLLSPSKDRWR